MKKTLSVDFTQRIALHISHDSAETVHFCPKDIPHHKNTLSAADTFSYKPESNVPVYRHCTVTTFADTCKPLLYSTYADFESRFQRQEL